uniref:Micrococcal nuclease-like nuclease n=1 Tax=Desulfovibrio sp. U5L TaxID=596152 RepID=I2Q0M2_9BACT
MAQAVGRGGHSAAGSAGPALSAAGWPARCLAHVVLCLVLGWPSGLWAALERVTVVRVLDGDTCVLADGRRLRLAGIDAPEMAHSGNPAQYYAVEATSLLARLTLGQPLGLALVGEGADRYGRTLGALIRPDGTSVAERMLGEGAAYIFWYRDLPRSLVERYLAIQRRAMAAGAGFWPRILALPAPAGAYVGNTASHRFHAPGCPDAGRIGPRNRVLLPTLGEAFGRGYTPARDCTPWPSDRDAGPGKGWNRKWP